MDGLLELSASCKRRHEFTEYDLSNITKRFKNLQKCDIHVIDEHNLIEPEKYAQIIQHAFQNSAIRVKLVLDEFEDSGRWNFIKEPLQRCVVTSEIIPCLY